MMPNDHIKLGDCVVCFPIIEDYSQRTAGVVLDRTEDGGLIILSDGGQFVRWHAKVIEKITLW